MKSYTDLEQSEKLTGILPLESADMQWIIDGLGKPFPFPVERVNENEKPCWSLTGLFGVLPDELTDSDGCVYRNEFFHLKGKYTIQYPRLTTLWPSLLSVEADNPVDACYEMILKLHEQKLI